MLHRRTENMWLPSLQSSPLYPATSLSNSSSSDVNGHLGVSDWSSCSNRSPSLGTSPNVSDEEQSANSQGLAQSSREVTPGSNGDQDSRPSGARSHMYIELAPPPSSPTQDDPQERPTRVIRKKKHECDFCGRAFDRPSTLKKASLFPSFRHKFR